MEARPLDGYVNLGTVFQGLCGASVGWLAYGNQDEDAGSAYVYLKEFLEGLEELQLNVTARMSATSALRQLKEELKQKVNEEPLSADEAQALSSNARKLWDALFAELKLKVAFIVSDLRMDAQKLLSDPASLMAPGVFAAMPETAQADFIQAGRCIAFELPTAAAFHLMRGTEAILRSYYTSVVKRGRVGSLNWGPMLNHLRQRRQPPPTALLDNLDNIRKNYRNPTAHPEKIYDIDEAQDLWALSVDVTNRMLKGSQR